MPKVTATPRSMSDGRVVTEFTDTVDTAGTTYTFPNMQDGITITNKGQANITLWVNGTSYVATPGTKQKATAEFTSVVVATSSGVQPFEVSAYYNDLGDRTPPYQPLVTSGTFRRTAKKIRAGQPVTIVCIGTSSTAGDGSSDPATTSYPAQLKTKLQAAYPLSTITVYNKGIGGQVTTEMLGRFGADVFNLNPDLVIWQTGTVEAMSGSDYNTYMMLLEAGAQALKDRHFDVALMDSQYYPGTGETSSYQKYLWGMSEIGARLGITVIPRYSLMRETVRSGQYPWPKLLWTDNFHPSDITYERVAQYIVDLIKPTADSTTNRSYRSDFYPVLHPFVAVESEAPPNFFYNANNTEQFHYATVNLTNTTASNNYAKFSIGFYGTGARFVMPFSAAHPTTMVVKVSVDDGIETVINQSPSINPSLHQGAFTLADNLPLGFHKVSVRFENTVGTSANTLYVTGFEVMAHSEVDMGALDRVLGKRVIWGLDVVTDAGMSVKANSGAVFANGREVVVGGTSVGVVAANATNPRIDLVYLSERGVISVATGTPAASPTAPATPKGVWELATVLVPANATSSASFTITDKRRLPL